ncbi:MAG: WD40 repeat domain-containing protein [Bacteroidota bacterium]
MPLEVKKIAQLTGHNAAIFSLSPDTDPRYFYSAAGDGWIVHWDMEAPELGKLVAKVEQQVFSVLHLPQEQLLVAGNMNGGVHWVDPTAPAQQRNIAHHEKGVFDLIQIQDYVFSVGGGGVVTKWSITERRTLESLALTNQSLRCIDFCPTRNELAIGSSDNNIYLLDATDLSIRHSFFLAHSNSVFSVRYAPNGRYLLSGGRDAYLRAWDLDNDYALVSAQPAHWYTINDIAFHPNGHLFATASRDKTIKIWDSETFQLLKVLDTIRNGCHINSVNRLLWSQHKDYLISCSDDRSIILWNITAK